MFELLKRYEECGGNLSDVDFRIEKVTGPSGYPRWEKKTWWSVTVVDAERGVEIDNCGHHHDSRLRAAVCFNQCMQVLFSLQSARNKTS
jgi:hypothetical protein